MSDEVANPAVEAVLRTLADERPEVRPQAWALLRTEFAALERRAKRFEARYIGVRAALDGMMDGELSNRVLRTARQLRVLAARVEASIDDGEMTEEREHFTRGRAAAYEHAAALLETTITVEFDGDRIEGAWTRDGEDGAQEAPVRQEAVPVAEGGQGGSAPDAGDAAGVHAVPVREASETDVAPEQEAARVNAGYCGHCGAPGIQGQPFSAGREYYCPRCDDVHAYPWAQSPPEAPWVTQLKEKDAEIARLKSQARATRNRIYNAWGAMRIPGGTTYADGVAAARAILLEAMNSLGWDVFDPDARNYHCSKCGRCTGMMGHGDVCPT